MEVDQAVPHLAGGPLLHSLLDFPLNLQERILSKLEYKSYFRSQQACKTVKELIQNDPKINIAMEASCRLNWQEDENQQLQLFFICNSGEEPRYQMPFGVRFEWLALPCDLKDNFETICDLLKKHRISSKEIDISQLPPDGSKGQLEEILKILKPKCLHIEGKDLDTEAIEPYFVLEDIERIEANVCPEPGEALPLVKKLFSMTRNLQLHLNPVNLSEDELYNLYTAVTGVLNSEIFPKLRTLMLCCAFEGATARRSPPKQKKVLDALRQFHPTVVKRESRGMSIKCSLFNPHSTLEFLSYKEFDIIEYRRTVPVKKRAIEKKRTMLQQMRELRLRQGK